MNISPSKQVGEQMPLLLHLTLVHMEYDVLSKTIPVRARKLTAAESLWKLGLMKHSAPEPMLLPHALIGKIIKGTGDE